MQYNAYSTVYVTHYITYNALYTVQSTQYRAYSTEHTVQSIQYRIYSTEYTVHCIQYIAYSLYLIDQKHVEADSKSNDEQKEDNEESSKRCNDVSEHDDVDTKPWKFLDNQNKLHPG